MNQTIHKTTVLDELEKLGTIIIMDKEEGDYAIITKEGYLTQRVLEKYQMFWSGSFNQDTQTHFYEFNLYHKEPVIEQ